MDIGSTPGVGGIGPVQGPQKPPPVAPSSYAQPTGPTDKVDISTHGQLLSQAREMPPVRTEKVEEIRRLLESGRFETQERLEGALDRFLEENPDVSGK